MKYKIKHKKEGWTGTMEITEGSRGIWYSSHRCGFDLHAEIEQDSYKKDGTYVEDPNVESLDELEIIKL